MESRICLSAARRGSLGAQASLQGPLHAASCPDATWRTARVGPARKRSSEGSPRSSTSSAASSSSSRARRRLHVAAFKDHYGILGVSRHASQQEIKAAFRKLARELHPDVAGPGAASEAHFVSVLTAYQTLSDEGQRAAYDKQLPRFSPPPPPWPRQPAAHQAPNPQWSGFPFQAKYQRANAQAEASSSQSHTSGPERASQQSATSAATSAATSDGAERPTYRGSPRAQGIRERMHSRKPFKSRWHAKAEPGRPHERDPMGPYEREATQSGSTHRTAAEASASATSAHQAAASSAASAAGVAAQEERGIFWRESWERMFRQSGSVGSQLWDDRLDGRLDDRLASDTKQVSLQSYLAIAQAKLASCFPPTWSLCADILFVWLTMVLWSLYGTQITLAWLAIVLLTNQHSGAGQKLAAAAGWLLGGVPGLFVVTALHASVWLAGTTNQHAAAVLSLVLLLCQQLSLAHPSLGHSAVGLLMFRVFGMVFPKHAMA